MKKTAIMAVLVCVCILSLTAVCTLNILAFAEGEYSRHLSSTNVTVTCGNKQVTVYTDPASYYEEATSGYLSYFEIRRSEVAESDNVMYTANYPDTTTGRTGNVTEYVCQPDGINFVVTSINTSGDGTTYIPIGGFVVSLSNQANENFAKVGDNISFSGNVTLPTKAVESSQHRVVVNNTNTTRSGPMVVYYDYQFGAKTGTNSFGTEMTCTYDFSANTFKVVNFRGFGTGDDSGSEIPDNSFVLSAYGEGYRQLLVAKELFTIGDEVKMVGFDFIRFGGTVVGTYDFTNPTEAENPAGMEFENSPFPAYRGTDQTIVYKYGWNYNGANGTGTNIYGYEAAVDANGVVVELGVNVSKIPENGYVISGHGKGRDFIRSNMVLGATVVLNEQSKTYAISTTLNSYYENLVTSVNNAVDSANNSIKRLYDVDSQLLQQLISQVTEQLQSLKVVKEGIKLGLENEGLTEQERLSLLMSYNNYQLQIERLQHQIIESSAESRAVSARGVWHRPTELTFADIQANIQTYKDCGINLVFVETLYNGYSAFRSDIAEFPYNTKLGSSYTAPNGTVYDDYLSAFTACCKQAGIEVHAWVENFYIGTLKDVPVLNLHPDWVMYNNDGTIFQRHEAGAYIFLDPANKEVQNTLINYYLNLFEKNPDVAGLNLDYIRYPVSDADDDTGYTMSAMQPFYEQLGLSFSSAQLADRSKMANKFKQLFDSNYGTYSPENYNLWVQYRADVITQYVKRIKTEVKDFKNITLSTSVFASVTESKNAKKQDWQTWFKNGWIDIATPMAYYTDASDVVTNVNNMILSAGNACYYYSGLASSFSGLPAWRNTEQVEASYIAGASGYVIFCSTQIIGHDDVQQALVSGVNSKQAVLPHASVQDVVSAYFADILDKCDRIYLSANGMTEAQRTALKTAFEEISQMSADSAVEIFKIQAKIKTLYASGISTYARGYSGQRITEELQQLVTLLDSKISVQLIADGDWNPEENAVRPTVSENGVYYPEPTPEQPGNNDEPTTPTEPTTPAEESNFPTWATVVISVGGVLVVSAVAVTIVVVIKRRKAN